MGEFRYTFFWNTLYNNVNCQIAKSSINNQVHSFVITMGVLLASIFLHLFCSYSTYHLLYSQWSLASYKIFIYALAVHIIRYSPQRSKNLKFITINNNLLPQLRPSVSIISILITITNRTKVYMM